MHPTLLILAAGRGSRFGGLKQLQPVGPSGEPLLAYTIYDAARAGFERVGLVCPPGFGAQMRDEFLRLTGGIVEISVVEQESPAHRAKPWGTGHAIYQAAPLVRDRPFGIANGDDWYGPSAIAQLATALRDPDRTDHLLVTYGVANTLVSTDNVSRGQCVVRDGRLVEIRELTGVRRSADGVTGVDADGSPVSLSPEAPVSMNLWGFTPAFLAHLSASAEAFHASPAAASPDAEFQLTRVIADLLERESGRFEALSTAEQPFGLTRPEDLPTVRAEIGRRVAAGVYPADLRTGGAPD